MNNLQRLLLLSSLLLTGLALGCSSRPPPMKTGDLNSGGSDSSTPFQINPKKVLPPEPEGPSAPPVQ